MRERAKRSSSGASETQQPHRISGDNSLRDPPVPIPNTEVKPQHADGTWLETARESRSSPDSIFEGCVLGGILQSKPNTISGDNSLRDPPVPIPNTEVKP